MYATMPFSSQSSTRCSSEDILVMSAPTVRTPLSADALFGLLRTGFAAIAAHRPGTPDIALLDAFMSAFAMFSLQSPSLLACDQERTEGNWQRVYGIERVPCDTARRDILDPVKPEVLCPLFKRVFGALRRGRRQSPRPRGHRSLPGAPSLYWVAVMRRFRGAGNTGAGWLSPYS